MSTGPAEEKVTVPTGLEGDLLYNVTATLEDAGLVVGTITQDDSSTLAENIVISVNPGEGTEVSKGTTVDITVSSGKGATKTLSYSVPLPSGNEDVTLTVYRNGVQVEQSVVNLSYTSSYPCPLREPPGQRRLWYL